MKKQLNKIFKSAIIFIVTLGTGFAVTAVSFNLFDNLSQNQMRLMFAIDIILLLAIAGGAYLLFESKRKRQKRDEALRQRHNRRVKERNELLNSIILDSDNKFAA